MKAALLAKVGLSIDLGPAAPLLMMMLTDDAQSTKSSVRASVASSWLYSWMSMRKMSAVVSASSGVMHLSSADDDGDDDSDRFQLKRSKPRLGAAETRAARIATMVVNPMYDLMVTAARSGQSGGCSEGGSLGYGPSQPGLR